MSAGLNETNDDGMRRRLLSIRPALLVTALIAALAMVFSPLVAPTAAQASNPSTGFNPGHIISDANFYDGNGMTAAQIQTFLNKRVPRCTIGDPGREAYRPWGSTKVAGFCLKNSSFSYQARAANSYCKAVAGGTRESGATIIAKVGRACGINPKVLLVMLEKEQSLVTDTWPTVRQFDVAMGYACPDSGPNNSANCDPSQTGFFQQVYRAAWQFKVYRAFPNSYGYKPFQTNTIQWHPNAGCGTSRVYIENWATAALYIYTPYRPNQAALNAGWGTGDSCSSYGNRNFYNFYKQWFGSPALAVDARLQKLYSANSAVIGAPKANAQEVAGGIRQEFERATMYWHSATGASFVSGGIRTTYLGTGGPGGSLGFPRSLQKSEGSGWNQAFQRGTVFWHSRYGGKILSGGIESAYRAQQGVTRLGYPTGNMTAMSQGWIQRFERGSMTWASGAGGVQVTGGIHTYYRAQRGPSTLGFAREPERYIAGAWWQPFDKGDIYWRSGAGGTVVSGGIRNGLASFGGAAKQGYPLGAQRKQADGLWRQSFRNGVVAWSPQGGSALLTGQILKHYNAKGSSVLGFPSGAQSAVGAGVKQEFTKGTLYKSPATPFVLTSGGIRNALGAAGGVRAVGFPMKPERRMPTGEWRQEYERALVLWSPQGGGGAVTGAIRDAYVSGSIAGAGFPRGNAWTEGVGRAQEFTKATVYARGTRVVPVAGGIRAEFNRQGGTKVLGFPVSAERKLSNGTWQQRFEKGTITWSAKGVRVAWRGLPDAPVADDTTGTEEPDSRTTEPEQEGTSDPEQPAGDGEQEQSDASGEPEQGDTAADPSQDEQEEPPAPPEQEASADSRSESGTSAADEPRG